MRLDGRDRLQSCRSRTDKSSSAPMIYHDLCEAGGGRERDYLCTTDAGSISVSGMCFEKGWKNLIIINALLHVFVVTQNQLSLLMPHKWWISSNAMHMRHLLNLLDQDFMKHTIATVHNLLILNFNCVTFSTYDAGQNLLAK